MRRLLLFAILMCAVIAASGFKQDSKVIEGDLYYSFLRIGSLYGVPLQHADSVKQYLDTATIEHAPDSDKELITKYAILKKEKLTYNPYVYVKLDNDSIIVVYMNKEDYARITLYHYKELQAKHQKVRLRFSAKHLGYDMFICRSLATATLTAGQTRQIQHKFKIDDYQ